MTMQYEFMTYRDPLKHGTGTPYLGSWEFHVVDTLWFRYGWEPHQPTQPPLIRVNHMRSG